MSRKGTKFSLTPSSSSGSSDDEEAYQRKDGRKKEGESLFESSGDIPIGVVGGRKTKSEKGGKIDEGQRGAFEMWYSGVEAKDLGAGKKEEGKDVVKFVEGFIVRISKRDSFDRIVKSFQEEVRKTSENVWMFEGEHVVSIDKNVMALCLFVLLVRIFNDCDMAYEMLSKILPEEDDQFLYRVWPRIKNKYFFLVVSRAKNARSAATHFSSK